jgi:uncharacterized membrane protein
VRRVDNTYSQGSHGIAAMKNYFFAGLIILLPVVITYWIIKFIVQLITSPFENLAFTLLDSLQLTHYSLLLPLISSCFILIVLTAIIIIVGAVGRWFLFHSFFHMIDRLLHLLPFVNKVYLSCKDFTAALFSSKSDSFSQVVLVPFPSKEHRSIGLVTSQFKNEVLDNKADELVSVLIPGTPNPTVGFLMMYSKEQLIFTQMRVDEALKYVMSCGSVLPKSIKF